jgi:ABC-type transporter Mla subunit MlaD
MEDKDLARRTTEADLKQHLQDTLALLTAVHSDVARLLDQIRDGNPGTAAELAARDSELESALLRVMKAEQRLNEWNGQTPGGAGNTGHDDIDFDALRHEIGCRLARIRDCCRSE